MNYTFMIYRWGMKFHRIGGVDLFSPIGVGCPHCHRARGRGRVIVFHNIVFVIMLYTPFQRYLKKMDLMTPVRERVELMEM